MQSILHTREKNNWLSIFDCCCCYFCWVSVCVRVFCFILQNPFIFVQLLDSFVSRSPSFWRWPFESSSVIFIIWKRPNRGKYDKKRNLNRFSVFFRSWVVWWLNCCERNVRNRDWSLSIKKFVVFGYRKRQIEWVKSLNSHFLCSMCVWRGSCAIAVYCVLISATGKRREEKDQNELLKNSMEPTIEPINCNCFGRILLLSQLLLFFFSYCPHFLFAFAAISPQSG